MNQGLSLAWDMSNDTPLHREFANGSRGRALVTEAERQEVLALHAEIQSALRAASQRHEKAGEEYLKNACFPEAQYEFRTALELLQGPEPAAIEGHKGFQQALDGAQRLARAHRLQEEAMQASSTQGRLQGIRQAVGVMPDFVAVELRHRRDRCLALCTHLAQEMDRLQMADRALQAGESVVDGVDPTELGALYAYVHIALESIMDDLKQQPIRDERWPPLSEAQWLFQVECDQQLWKAESGEKAVGLFRQGQRVCGEAKLQEADTLLRHALQQRPQYARAQEWHRAVAGFLREASGDQVVRSEPWRLRLVSEAHGLLGRGRFLDAKKRLKVAFAIVGIELSESERSPTVNAEVEQATSATDGCQPVASADRPPTLLPLRESDRDEMFKLYRKIDAALQQAIRQHRKAAEEHLRNARFEAVRPELLKALELSEENEAPVGAEPLLRQAREGAQILAQAQTLADEADRLEHVNHKLERLREAARLVPEFVDTDLRNRAEQMVRLLARWDTMQEQLHALEEQSGVDRKAGETADRFAQLYKELSDLNRSLNNQSFADPRWPGLEVGHTLLREEAKLAWIQIQRRRDAWRELADAWLVPAKKDAEKHIEDAVDIFRNVDAEIPKSLLTEIDAIWTHWNDEEEKEKIDRAKKSDNLAQGSELLREVQTTTANDDRRTEVERLLQQEEMARETAKKLDVAQSKMSEPSAESLEEAVTRLDSITQTSFDAGGWQTLDEWFDTLRKNAESALRTAHNSQRLHGLLVASPQETLGNSLPQLEETLKADPVWRPILEPLRMIATLEQHLADGQRHIETEPSDDPEDATIENLASAGNAFCQGLERIWTQPLAETDLPPSAWLDHLTARWERVKSLLESGHGSVLEALHTRSEQAIERSDLNVAGTCIRAALDIVDQADGRWEKLSALKANVDDLEQRQKGVEQSLQLGREAAQKGQWQSALDHWRQAQEYSPSADPHMDQLVKQATILLDVEMRLPEETPDRQESSWMLEERVIDAAKWLNTYPEDEWVPDLLPLRTILVSRADQVRDRLVNRLLDRVQGALRKRRVNHKVVADCLRRVEQLGPVGWHKEQLDRCEQWAAELGQADRLSRSAQDDLLHLRLPEARRKATEAWSLRKCRLADLLHLRFSHDNSSPDGSLEEDLR